MTEKKNVKDNHLKVRLSKKDNKEITLYAQSLNMNKSEYIRYCCLSTKDITKDTIPNYIKTANLLNDIVKQLEGNTDSQTLESIRRKIAKYYNKRGKHHE